ncbi:winged helix-turn-helix domain-containing protein [Pseudoduganella sp. LjRoot289]|uniref:nSTAND1 domain-containing NTPase n=1 Tax=Pseudoduganella sp. LjRoot289 TaxID=3342314 RepID=UPI003ECEA8F2
MSDRGFRFGEWQIEPESNILQNGNERNQLEPRAMDVLRYLCRHAGAVIPAEELLQACWGNIELGDNPVHKAITQLRRALGDSSTEPRFIETIRKRGYRAIAAVVANVAADEGGWLQGSPFRGLEAFQENHAAVFFGRMQAIAQLRDVVRKQAAAGCAMALVLGPSGSGKTSLVRAGLLPQLMKTNSSATEPVALECTLYLDCADMADGGLFQALAAVLLDTELDGKLVFTGDNAEALAKRLEGPHSDAVVERLGLNQRRPRVGLFVDRLEAIFRAPGVSEDLRSHFLFVLEQLARSGAALVMLACRNDFYPDVIALPALMALKSRGGHFDLSPPEGADIAQIVRQPARAAQLRFEQDAGSGASLDDVLCDAARGSPDTLPLLQYCLNELYRQRSADGTLLFSVFADLGGIDGAIAARAEQVVAALEPAQRAALPHVLSLLVDLSEEQGTVTARRAAWSSLHSDEAQALVRALVEARLFVSELASDVASFGVTHEALLRRWPRVADWIEQHRNALQVRTRIGRDAERWQAASRPRDLLLPRGSQVNQARALLDLDGFTLAPLEQEFVRSSVQRVKLGERIKLAMTVGVTLLAILAVILGIVARNAERDAEQQRTEAEGLMSYMLGEFVEKLRPLGRLDLLDGISGKALTYLSSTRNTNVGMATLVQRAKALQVIGEVNIARSNLAKASEALQAARNILLKLEHTNSDRKELYKALGNNAFFQSQVHFRREELDQAEQYIQEYRVQSDRMAAIDPADSDGWMEQSYAHNGLGAMAMKRGQFVRAAEEFATSVQLKQRAHDSQPGNQKLMADLANTLSWLAEAKAKQGLLKEAMEFYHREEELLRPLHDAAPGNATWTNRLASALTFQGELKISLGQQSSARINLLSAEELLREVVNQDLSNRHWQLSLYTVQMKLLDLDRDLGDAAGTLPKQLDLLAKLAALGALSAKEQPSLLPQLTAVAQQSLAATQVKLGHLAEARRQLTVSTAMLERLYETSKGDSYYIPKLAMGLLMQADLERANGASGSAQRICLKVKQLLGAVGEQSSNYTLLAPYVLAQHCLGELEGAQTQKAKLESMNYHELNYMKAIAAIPAKGAKP